MPEKPAVLAEPPAAPVAKPVRRVGVAMAIAAVVAVALVALSIARPWESQTAVDRFWAPVLSSPDPVSVYIGGYATETPPVNTIDLQNRIQDHNDLQSPKWSDDMNAPYQNLKQDFAIVSRLVDPTTGRVVVTASGLAKFGTEAAGEFLTSRSALEEMAKTAPKDWDRKNMQIVIGTDTVGRSAGPPHVLAPYFW